MAINVEPIESHLIEVLDELKQMKDPEIRGRDFAPEEVSAIEWEAIEQRQKEVQELHRVGLYSFDEAKAEAEGLNQRQAA